MTYCVGLLLDTGMVFLSDSRTNAGVDAISTGRAPDPDTISLIS